MYKDGLASGAIEYGGKFYNIDGDGKRGDPYEERNGRLGYWVDYTTTTVSGNYLHGQTLSAERSRWVNVNSNGGDGYDWSYTGNLLGVGGITYAGLENAVANKFWWMDAKGNYNSTTILEKGANGKFVRGVQGYRNGYNNALNAASKFKVAGNIVGGLSLSVTYLQFDQGQISGLEATVDAVFGVVGFLGPIGAGVSATYFIVKFGYEYFSGNTVFDKPR